MALGDGIRRNIAHVSQAERDRFIAAILQMDTSRFFPDGVSYFDKQEEIHKNAHAAGANVHGGPAFIPWHRELCNRFESLLREVDPDLSLHYWDWTTDPRATSDGSGGTVNLFTSSFMGGTGDPVGPPLADFESTEPGHTHIWRQVGAAFAKQDGTPNIPADAMLLSGVTDFAQLHSNLLGPHGNAHGYIGGSLSDAHYSFHDPFVFLLHSNLDRLWAMWQTEPGATGRMDPATAYGSYSGAPSINQDIQPWAGDVGTGFPPLRPWAPPDNMQEVKTYKDISVVAPPCYDTLPTTVQIVQAENPGSVIRFTDVPQGETAARAAVFEIFACDDITLRVTAGPGAPYTVLSPAGGVLTVPHRPQHKQVARIWFAFTGATPGAPVPSGTVTIHCDQTGQDFTFTLQANSIARPTVAVMLTLDQSGSMGLTAGIDATTKRIDVLHQAATNFVQLVQDNNGVGMVSFDHAAHPGVPVTRFTGGPFDPARAATLTAIQAIHPAGATSIGNGLVLARNTLNPVTGYDQQALVVFTDGLENTPQYIADVSSTINSRTYAIGLGTAQQVSAGALNALTSQTGGYMLLSGPLSPSVDEYFRLTKYFLQILAGVTNNNIVTDPDGYLSPGMKVRIPFILNETDIDSTVILLTDVPLVRFLIETPNGDLMDPAKAAAIGARYANGTRVSYYRFTLPLPLGPQPARAGTWHALLEIDAKPVGVRLEQLPEDTVSASARGRGAIRYSLSVHSLSNLKMDARLTQHSLQPGADMTIRAVLTEYGIPVEHRAAVVAELERPDGTRTTTTMSEVEPGVFQTDVTATLAGVYRCRVLATGVTMRGAPFTREHLVSGVAIPNGDAPPPTSTPGQHGCEHLCELFKCLMANDSLSELLRARHVNAASLIRCVERWCERCAAGPTPEELAQREGTATG